MTEYEIIRAAIDCVMIHKHHAAFRDILFHNLGLHENGQRRITGIYRMLNLQIDDLEEIKRLVSINKYPKVYLKGETMDGKNLVYTVVQPEKTAGDIKEWSVAILIDDVVKGTFTLPIEQQAFDFRVPKGTQAIRVSVAFTDTSGNLGDATVSELFDAPVTKIVHGIETTFITQDDDWDSSEGDRSDTRVNEECPD